MTNEQWLRIKELFEAALDQPPEARESFIAAACGDDAELRAEVENLLAGHERAGSFLDKPAASLTPPLAPKPAETPAFAPDKLISGRFQIIRFLGRGGMGEVYAATDLELGERVALKTIRHEISSDAHALARFKQEIQLARRVTHPNVCRIFDFERHIPPGADSNSVAAITFLTMELLEGETLSQRLRQCGPIPTAQALPLVKQMAGALTAAHDAGIIHRDFKPSNVMLVSSSVSEAAPEGCRAVVMDFGLARIAAQTKPGCIPAESLAHSLTAAGQVLGTLAYMAPEQLEGGPVSPATDVYALGLVMYEMVTGVSAFPEDLPFVGIFKRVKEPPAPPCQHLPDLDSSWNSVILRCLEIDPARRFQNARDVVAALEGQLGSGGWLPETPRSPADSGQLHSETPRGPTRGWPLRKRLAVAGAAFVFFLALLAPYLRVSLLKASWMPAWLRPAPTLSEGASILVADFENSSGEKLFDRTVSDLVARALQQSHEITVIPRQGAMEAIQRTGRTNVAAIDEGLGREICIREDYRALLAGRIVKQQSAYVIDVSLVDPVKGRVVLTGSQRFGSAAELSEAADRLVARLQPGIVEALGQIAPGEHFAAVTTPSRDALRQYTLAFDRYGRRDYDGALTFAQSAVDLDPNFAMAHLLLARIYDSHGLADRTDQQLNLARRAVDTVTEREKHMILATDYLARQNHEKAAAEYALVVQLAPNDPDALRGQAAALSFTSQIRSAVEIQRRVLQLSPDDVVDYNQLMSIQIRLNDFQPALETGRQARNRKLDAPNLHYNAAIAYWGLDDVAAARQELEALGQGSDVFYENFARIWLASLLVYEGRLKEADHLLRTGPLTGTERTGGLVIHRYVVLGRINLLRGDEAAARENARRAAQAAFEGAPAIALQEAGLLAVDAGDLSLGRKLLARLRRLCAGPTGEYMHSALDTVQGAAELAGGKPDAAIESQRRSAAYAQAFESFLRLGQAYRAKRDWPSAIEAYKHYLEFKGLVLDNVAPGEWVLAHLELARLYERTGDVVQSLHYYDDFLRLWVHADADLKQVREARAERAAVALRQPKP